MMISDNTSRVINVSSSNTKGKSIDTPTVIKKSASNKSLKGSVLTSSLCLNLLSALTTPYKKIPSTVNNPIFCMTTAMIITKNRAKTVNNSGNHVSAK